MKRLTEAPSHLKHKPILAVNNYQAIDQQTGKGYHDCVALSVGVAQWNLDGKKDISVKVWRHSGERWSRQSEEMPLHRCFDLTILILSAFLKDRPDDITKVKSYLKETVVDEKNFHLISDYIQQDTSLMERIGELKRLMGKYDKI